MKLGQIAHKVAGLHHHAHNIVHAFYFTAAGLEGSGYYSYCAWALLALTVVGWLLPERKHH